MRTFTIALSVVVHVLAAMAAVVTPILAYDEIPEPRRATEYIVVMPVEPAPPRPPAPAVRRALVDAAPVEAPSGVQPERDAPPPDPFDTPDNVASAIVPGDAAGPPPALPPPPTPVAPMTEAVRVGGNIRPPTKLVNVSPEYPAIARASRTSGIVILEAVIGEEGEVRAVRVLRSIPLLDHAAIDAVRQWRFTPTLLNNKPVPVVMTVTVSFALN